MTINQFINTLDILEYSKGWYDLLEASYDLALSEKALEIIEFREMNYLSESTYFVEKEEAKEAVAKNKKSFGEKFKSIMKWIWDHTIGAFIRLFTDASESVKNKVRYAKLFLKIQNYPEHVNKFDAELTKIVNQLNKYFDTTNSKSLGKAIYDNKIVVSKLDSVKDAISPTDAIYILKSLTNGKVTSLSKKLYKCRSNPKFSIDFKNAAHTLTELKKLKSSANFDAPENADSNMVKYLQDLKKSVSLSIRLTGVIIGARKAAWNAISKYESLIS